MAEDPKAPSAPAPTAPATAPDPAPAPGPAQARSPKRPVRTAGLMDAFISDDPPTRRMGRYFLLSLVGLIFVATLTVQHFLKRPNRLDGFDGIEKYVKTQSRETDEAIAKPLASVGRFTIELKPAPGPAAPGVLNLGELDIVLETDTMETRAFVEENLERVKNQLTDVLVPMDRNELLSRDGKKRLKKRIMMRLNAWLPRGKIQDVFFSKLLVN